MTPTVDRTMPELPDDIEGLRALLLTTMAERDELAARNAALETRNARLQHLLLKLERMQFGRKSERLPEEQLQLGLEDIEQAVARNEAEAEKCDPALRGEQAARRRANRGALPAHPGLRRGRFCRASRSC